MSTKKRFLKNIDKKSIIIEDALSYLDKAYEVSFWKDGNRYMIWKLSNSNYVVIHLKAVNTSFLFREITEDELIAFMLDNELANLESRVITYQGLDVDF